MQKTEFYTKLNNVITMIDGILETFRKEIVYADVLYMSVDVMANENGILISTMDDYNPMKSGIDFATKKGAYVALNNLHSVNKKYGFGWEPYLTALELGIDEINRLMTVEVE